jgi:LmbE family N-acetylglucosaminyl deacetylase
VIPTARRAARTPPSVVAAVLALTGCVAAVPVAPPATTNGQVAPGGSAGPAIAPSPAASDFAAPGQGPSAAPTVTALPADEDAGIASPSGQPITTAPSPLPGAGTVWTPPSPLPAPPDGRKVDIVLSPHPDDETLSLGVWIAQRSQAGHRVIVVALTDGRSTNAIQEISARLHRTLSRDEIGAARIAEMQAADVELGVAPGDLYRAELDDDAGDGGSRATEAEIGDVIDAFARAFPGAAIATMSDLAEHHPDHLNAGRALMTAWLQQRVRNVVFAISRLYWRTKVPNEFAVAPPTEAVRDRVLAAGRAYGAWDPDHGRLSVGWYSVRTQFDAMLADPVDHLHLPASPAAVTPVTTIAGPLPSG